MTTAPYGIVATYDSYDLFGNAGVLARFSSGSGQGTNMFSNTVYTFAAPSRLATDYSGRDGGYFPGGPLGNALQYDDAGGVAYAFDMRPDRVLITGDLQAAIPEPGTWLLTICGFGVAGAHLRRRRACTFALGN